jgi:hypothetical protein
VRDPYPSAADEFRVGNYRPTPNPLPAAREERAGDLRAESGAHAVRGERQLAQPHSHQRGDRIADGAADRLPGI